MIMYVCHIDRFCFLMGCGCVFSDRALKEIKDSICVNVSKAQSLNYLCVKAYLIFVAAF